MTYYFCLGANILRELTKKQQCLLNLAIISFPICRRKMYYMKKTHSIISLIVLHMFLCLLLELIYFSFHKSNFSRQFQFIQNLIFLTISCSCYFKPKESLCSLSTIDLFVILVPKSWLTFIFVAGSSLLKVLFVMQANLLQ